MHTYTAYTIQTTTTLERYIYRRSKNREEDLFVDLTRTRFALYVYYIIYIYAHIITLETRVLRAE